MRRRSGCSSSSPRRSCFGSFFTAYFFIRVNGNSEWPLEPFHLPVFVAGVNTAILVTSSFTIHWALQSIKRGNRAGTQAGLVLTLALGSTFLITQMLEYARVGFSPADGAFGTIFYGLTGLHGAHVFVGLTLLTFATIRAFRNTSASRITTVSRSPASTALRGRNVDRGVRDHLPRRTSCGTPSGMRLTRSVWCCSQSDTSR